MGGTDSSRPGCRRGWQRERGGVRGQYEGQQVAEFWVLQLMAAVEGAAEGRKMARSRLLTCRFWTTVKIGNG
ncbi:hypothetical protein AMTR_s00125p00017400 [Amborella trichopoda]|uniref:Uncharacterized protein n=1 Tax=Amborella trichopoda TaxID=13333 RepID=W1NRV8_AMBTC|nr:hypothetical protein AMTR_s00125p00017400 [Amborella trichopoda]